MVKIDDDAFAGLSNLLSLSVNEGSLRYLSASAFSGLSRLKVLDISNNRLERAYPDWISGGYSLHFMLTHILESNFIYKRKSRPDNE